MCSCNSCATPMKAKLKLLKVSDSKPVDTTMYRSLIDSLRYLLHTRPELTYSVCYLSRFMEVPKQEHLDAVKRVLRYVAGTVDYSLLYPEERVEVCRFWAIATVIWLMTSMTVKAHQE
jgi:hypothetical protein